MKIVSLFFGIIPFTFYFIGTFCLITVTLPDNWIIAFLGSLTTDGSVSMPTELIMPTFNTVLVSVALLLLTIGYILQTFRGSILRRATIYIETLSDNITSTHMEMYQAVRVENRLHLVVLATIIAIGVMLRLYCLKFSILSDEAYTYLNYVQMPLLVGLTDLDLPNNHLFNTLLSHISVSVFGESTIAIRLPALLAGIVIVPVSYVASRFIFDKNIAIIATSFVATNYTLIEYSAKARGYSLATLFFLILLISSFRIAKTRTMNTLDGSLQFVSIVASLYAIPSMIYAVLGNFLFLFTIALRKYSHSKLLKNLFLLAGATFVTCAALYSVVFTHIPYEEWKASPTIKRTIEPQPFNSFFAGNLSYAKQTMDNLVKVYPDSFKQLIFALIFFGIIIVCVKYSVFAKYLFFMVIATTVILLIQRVSPYPRSWQYLTPLAAGLASTTIVFALSRFLSKKLLLSTALLIAALNSTAAGSEFITIKEKDHFFKDSPKVGALLKDHYKKGDTIFCIGKDKNGDGNGGVIGIVNFYLYHYDVFKVRQHDNYSIGAYIDHFRGKETHMDMFRHYQAMEHGFVYDKNQIDTLKNAKRIFFIVYLRVQSVEFITSNNPAGFTSPKLFWKHKDVEVYLSNKIPLSGLLGLKRRQLVL